MSAQSDFWSRRKAAVEAEAESEARARDSAVLQEERLALEQKTDEKILDELNLQDPDTLEPGDDFAAFLHEAVPERLRRRALRRLWLSNPVLANLDELVDYGEDYTDAATVVENLQTAYQVGKGMMKHVLEMTKTDEDSEGAEGGQQPLEADAPDERVDPAPDEPATDENTELTAAEPAPDVLTDPAAGAPARRRLRFEFATSQ